MQMTIVFDENYELMIDLFENDFVSRWLELLQHEIEHNTLIQEHAFSNFIPESLAIERLEQSINTVNKFLRHQLIPQPVPSDYADPEFYNRLHEKFEQLVGPDWENPTRLMLVAPKQVKWAIRDINRYCHRLEKRPYVIEPEMIVEFRTERRLPLQQDDYKLFEPVSSDHTVILGYSTLGKSLHECYQDGLTPDYAGLKIQHHYSANFVLRFGQITKLKPEQGFLQWLDDHGITNVPTATGHLQLGHIVNKNSFDKIKQCVKISHIRLE